MTRSTRFFLLMFLLILIIDASLNASENENQAKVSKKSQKSPSRVIDLDKMTKRFVVETKRIKIPKFPNAFNPSITRWRGSLLMSFRETDLWNLWRSKIGLIWLDENFNPIGKAQLLNTRVRNPYIPSRTEDARLVTIGDRLYVIYNDSEDAKDSPDFRKMFFCEIDFDGENFFAVEPEVLRHYQGECGQWEKNWVPFDYSGEMLLAYSINPHLVFKPERGTEGCQTISSSSASIEWEWGTLRGGTPAVLIGDEYLAFFHSSKPMVSLQSKNQEMYHYFIGAYKFKKEPPFNITKVSPEPIIGKGFYDGPHQLKHVVFPGGFVYDDKYIWVIYGRDDAEVWLVKLDREKLFKTLIPIQSNK